MRILAYLLILACINDSRSVVDEQMIANTADFDLIAGQFPHHGATYWSARLDRAKSRLAKNPNQTDAFIAWNDLAVALVKLGRFDDATAQLAQNERDFPKRYETAANLGVLHTKSGRYAEAAAAIRRSLSIKPSGHIGLGDYYARMNRYRAACADGLPTADFLGRPYADPPTELEGVDEGKLRALIRSDFQFADAMLVLGDLLMADDQAALALMAYARARALGHKAESVVDARYDVAAQAVGAKLGGTVHDHQAYRFERTFEDASLWLASFQEAEATLVRKALTSGQPLPGFEQVLAQVEPPLRQSEVMLESWTLGSEGILGIGGLCVVILLVVYFRQSPEDRKRPMGT